MAVTKFIVLTLTNQIGSNIMYRSDFNQVGCDTTEHPNPSLSDAVRYNVIFSLQPIGCLVSKPLEWLKTQQWISNEDGLVCLYSASI